jgi:hypothetical protein
MISQEDYTFIVAFDNADAAGREALLRENRAQCAKTFLNLLGHVSKDQTIQYILIMIDDMLQVFTYNTFGFGFDLCVGENNNKLYIVLKKSRRTDQE